MYHQASVRDSRESPQLPSPTTQVGPYIHTGTCERFLLYRSKVKLQEMLFVEFFCNENLQNVIFLKYVYNTFNFETALYVLVLSLFSISTSLSLTVDLKI